VTHDDDFWPDQGDDEFALVEFVLGILYGVAGTILAVAAYLSSQLPLPY
jgi:hypothetical protein